MKKLGMFLMLVLSMAMASHHAMAQEITIVLKHGCNWISYPNAEDMSIATALGNFTPAEGDVIKSQTKSAKYVNGQWKGTLKRFTPGLGYQYYSTRTTTVSFVFGGAASLGVTTSEPTGITSNSAISGGSVVSNDGTAILMKGVCWATHPHPTTNDAYSENGSTPGSFTEEITGLIPSTVYYARAFAVSVKGVNYGEEVSFTTLNNGGGNDHEYVDLGLPSGTLWATCNVGAVTPEDYGDFFAWGETQPKNVYNWATYKYGRYNRLTKYCTNSSCGFHGFVDNMISLEASDDAATANWGADWRMPTKTEWGELFTNTTNTWITTQDGVNGRLFTGSNGNTLFLPAAGTRWNDEHNYAGTDGAYWSKSIVTSSPNDAWDFDFDSNTCWMYGDGNRSTGLSVRAVRSTSQNCTINVTANPTSGGLVSGGGTYQQGTNCTLTATANEGYIFINWSENGEVISTNTTYSFTVNGSRNLMANFVVSGGSNLHAFVDLGLPSGTLWATCNVGADSPEDRGDYFAWAETQPKSDYGWHTYRYYVPSIGLTKYTPNDGLTILQSGDDAATANYFGSARIPTKEEWQELIDHTTSQWTTLNGVNGRWFVGANGNSLFLPAVGHRWGTSLEDTDGIYGFYWSSSLYLGHGYFDAWRFDFDSSYQEVIGYSNGRACGHSVRAVRSAK